MFKQLKRRWLAKLCLLLLASTALCAIANDKPPVAQCKSYLAMSAASFANAIKDQTTAGEISATLSSCEKYNSCSEIDGIDKCSVLLFNRGFDSLLAFESAANNNNSSSDTAIENNNTQSTASVDNNNGDDDAASTDNSSTSSDSNSDNSNNNNSNKESINWF